MFNLHSIREPGEHAKAQLLAGITQFALRTLRNAMGDLTSDL
jgi:hypothetical protein